ncbi:MAG: DNA polymerase III subunit gamma/tau [Lysobacterales bacterium]
MTYQVLARKWRPKNFADLVGQDHVVRALVNALDQDRVHHAFLFTGTRGVGKTTVARIFARALNCEKGVSSNPCGECRACVDILDGRFLDLIEVDAASRTKVEDTRELLENVQYAPTSGRFKVYLIDEVHMLSTSSFNALLKTLEEPPPQVKFLFATTDPQKLPVTVLSRCLQFNLKRISQAQIEEYLLSITGQEDFEAEPEALKLLANAADGSMRDALSLLDQAVAYGAGQAKGDDVRAMLGTVQAKQLTDLMTALCTANAEGVWQAAQEMVTHSPDFGRVLGEIAQMLHRAALVQLMPSVEDEDAMVQALARALSPEDLQLYYEITLHGRRDLDLAPDHRCGFEMTLLRMLSFTNVDDGNGNGGATDQSPSPAAQQNAVQKPSGAPTASNAPVQSGAAQGATTDAGAAKAEARRLAAAIASGSTPRPAPPVAAKTEKPAAPPAEPLARQAATAAEVARPEAHASDSANMASVSASPEPVSAAAEETQSQASAEPEPPLVSEDSVSAPAPVVNENPVHESVAPTQVHEPAPVERLPQATAAPDNPAQSQPTHSWDGIIDSLNLQGTAGVMARNSVLKREGQGRYLLTLDQKMEHLHTPQAEARIREGLTRYFGKDMQLKIALGELQDHTPADRHTEATEQRQRDAEAAIDDDPLVQSLKQQMGAEVIPGSVRPNNSH